MKCCLCNRKIEKQWHGWDQGHNAAPLKEGRCCDDCNWARVVPARLQRLFTEQEAERWPRK